MLRRFTAAAAALMLCLLTACAGSTPAATTAATTVAAATAAAVTTVTTAAATTVTTAKVTTTAAATAAATAAVTTAATTTAAATTAKAATTTAAQEPQEPVDIQLLGIMAKAQDGAVWGDWFFRFAASGIGNAYRVSDAVASGWKSLKPVSAFLLDRYEEIVPHSNSVCFGAEYYDPDDEFPLLYSNIYNNYEKEADKLWGTCCVYRLTRDGDTFSTELVQIIRIGFVNDGIWKDSIYYGNFAVDRDSKKLVAFLMRRNHESTRYFLFDLPSLSDGEPDPKLGVNCVTLEKDDILSYFDGPYSNFVQGACVHGGRLYSVEGRGAQYGEAGLRVVDLEAEKELYFVDFAERGMPSEPELIDFTDAGALYADYTGMLYLLDIELLEAETPPTE